MSRDDAVRAAAEAAHDAYERRAAEVGWETQARSRVAWADVPEANKQAMYAAMDAAAPHLTADLVRERDEALAEVERLRAQVERLRAQVGVLESCLLSIPELDRGPDDPAGCPGGHGAACCGYHDICRAALRGDTVTVHSVNTNTNL